MLYTRRQIEKSLWGGKAIIREIGSEFWDIPTIDNKNKMFPGSVHWFLSGRSALLAIIKELHGCHTVAMPSWCCDSVIKPFVDAGMEVRFYPAYWDKKLIQEPRFDCDVLFLMDYFGFTMTTLPHDSFQGIVIRDVTHSVFSASYQDADYYFGSLRKWCGVWTGGYAWTRDGRGLTVDNADDGGYALLRERAMQLKNSYINGYVDNNGRTVTDKEYLKLFAQAEKMLEHLGALPADQRDIRAAQLLDADYIRKRRRQNAEVLMEAFPDWLVFPELCETDCPLFVPILVPEGKRDALRRSLIQSEIYCPVHWPTSEYHKLTEQERFLYDNELSLVCDQRYAKEDMERVVDTIQLFMEREA